jgi:hypothetical protein
VIRGAEPGLQSEAKCIESRLSLPTSESLAFALSQFFKYLPEGHSYRLQIRRNHNANFCSVTTLALFIVYGDFIYYHTLFVYISSTLKYYTRVLLSEI